MGHLNRFAILALILAVLGAAASASYLGSDGAGGHGSTPAPPGPSAADRRIEALQQIISLEQANPRDYTELGFLHLQKARETADPSFYTRADESFGLALRELPGDPSALVGAASVALARHEFAGALTLAEQARAASPRDPDASGVVFDALVELGRYDEAFAALQQMADLRPDLNSYSRISYARELSGDLDGAMEAMQLAVDAAGPSGETAAWVRLQLGNLYFQAGDLDMAEGWFDRSLDAEPAYLHALAALGRLAAARGNFEEAADLYVQATERLPVLEYVVALGDVYEAAGDQAEATRQYELVAVMDQLLKANGVKTDLELALFYADHGDPDRAVELARAAYVDRPSVQGADALAWALFRAGMTGEALTYSREALRLGWSDNTALFHAAMIEADSGDPAVARRYLELVAARNPRFSPRYASLAADTLAELENLARS